MDGSPRRVVKRARVTFERFVRKPAKENQREDGGRKTNQQ